MQSDLTDQEAVKEANERFYEAFGALAIEGMDAVWDNSDRSLCVHPGWRPLLG